MKCARGAGLVTKLKQSIYTKNLSLPSHHMSVMAFLIIGNSIVCPKVRSGYQQLVQVINKWNAKVSNYWHFIRRINLWPVDLPNNGHSMPRQHYHIIHCIAHFPIDLSIPFLLLLSKHIYKITIQYVHVNASALWTHYTMRLCKIDLRNNNDKTMQPIEYKLIIPNTFHIERVNHCGLERKFEISVLFINFIHLIRWWVDIY